MESYGPFMTDEERAAAAAEFLDTHRDVYEDADSAAVGIIDNTDELLRLQRVLNDPAYDAHDSALAGTIPFQQGDVNDLVEGLPRQISRAAETESGSRELADAVAEAGAGRTNFVSDLAALTDNPDELERLETAVSNAGIGAAVEATARGESERADELLRGVGVSSDDWTPKAIRALRAFAGGGRDFDFRVDNPELEARFGTAATALGLASLVARGEDIFTGNAEADQYISYGADTVGVSKDIFKSPLTRLLGEDALGVVGKVASGVGVVLSAAGAVQALSEGDEAGAALLGLSALGGALVLSNTVPVVGHALVAVAAVGQIGLAQYRKSEASNYFEEGHPGAEDARRFLNHALSDSGLPQDQRDRVINTLKDSDDDGTLPGERLARVAEQAGVDPNEFFNRLAGLSQAQVQDVVNAVHSLDGENVDLLTTIGVEDVTRDVTLTDLERYIEFKTGLINR